MSIEFLILILTILRLIGAYIKLIDMQYIDFIVDIFENDAYTTNAEYLPLFIKFEFMTMQSLTVILGDKDYSEFWSDKAKARLLNYSMIVLLKATGLHNHTHYKQKSRGVNGTHAAAANVNHIYYAEQNANKHSLAHTIMTITELMRYDSNMRLFYKNHKQFKHLIISLYKKYGAKSKFITIDPGISYALNHLIRVLYIQNVNRSSNEQQLQVIKSQDVMISNANNAAINNQATRVCSNPGCSNEETKYKPFKICQKCHGQNAAYCSSKCKNTHLEQHTKYSCIDAPNVMGKSKQQITSGSASSLQAQLAFSAPSIGRAPISRRASDNFFKNLNDDMALQPNQQQMLTTANKVKMPKYKSSLESNSNAANANFNAANNNPFAQNRRSSFNMKPSDGQQPSLPGQHFIKNKPSFSDMSSTKPKLMNGFLSIGKQMGLKSALVINSNEDKLQFVRPLKTSTALCLTDLTTRSKQQLQNGTVRPEQSIVNGDMSSRTKKQVKYVSICFKLTVL
jgi:hypothetical protein